MKREYLDALIQSYIDFQSRVGVDADSWYFAADEIARLERVQTGLGIKPYRQRRSA